jgi:glutaredoxin
MKNILTIGLFAAAFNVIAQIPAELALIDAIDGNDVYLTDYNKGKGLVVIFTSNNCPYDLYYKDRIKSLEAEYKEQGINFILVNALTDAGEELPAMKKHAEEAGYNSPYLADKEKVLLAALEISKSPEAVILKNQEEGPVIFYKGAIDNNPQVASDVKEHYLKRNIENLLNNKPADPAEVRTTGCRIK